MGKALIMATKQKPEITSDGTIITIVYNKEGVEIGRDITVNE